MMRILLIEDDQIFADVLVHALETNGFDVAWAARAEQGLDIAWEHHPDAILVDLAMPGMDGIAVIEALRNHPATAQVPIIVTTALGTTDYRIRAQAAGCDAYLVKPFRVESLLDAVATVT